MTKGNVETLVLPHLAGIKTYDRADPPELQVKYCPLNGAASLPAWGDARDSGEGAGGLI